MRAGERHGRACPGRAMFGNQAACPGGTRRVTTELASVERCLAINASHEETSPHWDKPRGGGMARATDSAVWFPNTASTGTSPVVAGGGSP